MSDRRQIRSVNRLWKQPIQLIKLTNPCRNTTKMAVITPLIKSKEGLRELPSWSILWLGLARFKWHSFHSDAEFNRDTNLSHSVPLPRNCGSSCPSTLLQYCLSVWIDGLAIVGTIWISTGVFHHWSAAEWPMDCFVQRSGDRLIGPTAHYIGYEPYNGRCWKAFKPGSG